MRRAAALLIVFIAGCAKAQGEANPPAAMSGSAPSLRRAPAPDMTGRPLRNRFAYIPAQCYTSTRTRSGRAANPCFVCHANTIAPNYVDDIELQQVMNLPSTAANNPWQNLFAPAVERAAKIDDSALLAYVRVSNYFDDRGHIVLADRLAALPPEWDGDGDSNWTGFVPDAWFHFDERGFDRRPDGTMSGWRALAYYPLPGTFFPTNGSIGDVLVRLDPALREDVDGHSDQRVTEINLAIVEALITRGDVAIDPVDEGALHADLDLDGKLSVARRVRFDPRGQLNAMHYVGRAHALELSGEMPIAPGLFPLGTEFLHTLRYLDVSAEGQVAIAPRLKELRYAKKVRWFSYASLKSHAAAEVVEQRESATGALEVSWQFDRGVYNLQGWLLQGFIEAADGSLRPQTYEETAFCVGCHGGIGITTDSMFSMARKLSSPAHGYFHWSQHDLHGLAEPKRADGSFEYSLYLEQNGAGDEFRDNEEVSQRFFDRHGALRPDRVRMLHRDIATLLMPSTRRALALDRAYRAVVLEQSFTEGRDATLAVSEHVQRRVDVLAKTGIVRPVAASPLRAAHWP